MAPDFTNMIKSPDDILHRSIGLFNFIQSVYGWRFGKDIEIEVKSEHGQQIVTYHTPRGTVRTVGGLTEEMQRAGASLGRDSGAHHKEDIGLPDRRLYLREHRRL